MPPLLPPWAQNDIQKGTKMLQKSIRGALMRQHLAAFFLLNTYWQHFRVLKNVILCRVSSWKHLLTTLPYVQKLGSMSLVWFLTSTAIIALCLEMPPLPHPWAQNDIQKRAQILHKSIPGCTDGGASCRVFVLNTYWQHSRILKNVILCRVSSFEKPTDNIALYSKIW